MKYISIIAVVAVALIIGWVIVTSDNLSDFVVLVHDDIAELEEELLQVEAAVQTGTFTPAEASAARGRIINRINAIEASASASGKAELTVGQRQQLSEGLDRLKQILITYQATLTSVDSTADATGTTRSGGSGKSLTEQLAATVDSFSDTVAEVVPDYEPNAETQALVDDIIENGADDEWIDELEDMDETASSSEEMDDMSDDALTDDETATSSDTMDGDMEDTMSDDATSTDDMVVEDDPQS